MFFTCPEQNQQKGMNLKSVSAIFYQIFIFLSNNSPLKRFKRTNGSVIVYDLMNWLA